MSADHLRTARTASAASLAAPAPDTPAPHTAAAAESAELAWVTRAGAVESRHIGSAVLLGPDGTVLESLGAPQRPIFPRSTLKPFQAIASLRSGALISQEAVALACGSHNGSRRHQEVAAGVLAEEKLDESHLRCPAAYPSRERDLVDHIAAGREKTPLAFNCSGKHAAFLAATRTQGWRLATYTEARHPMQQAVMAVLEEYCEETPGVIGTDGCGAPAPSMSLTGLARGFSKIASATSRRDAEVHAFTVSQAMLDYPWAVHGRGEVNTVVMEELGLLAKLGAEGVLVIGAPDGTTVAVKTLDGSQRANNLVALSLLAAHDVIDVDSLGAVLKKIIRPITGGVDDAQVGSIRLSHTVLERL
ncbi:asparaginase [Nesterenkonia xinjiangensis]|uniref:L-asparaginase II n=1 Tax=Nesterenkonia xinjiangensis TaxID=225327 RepID=A0A7Z0KBK9_9MICC|nr:asparaginase [Nesterenkonia xinjiangensis]NYJ77722.1 L-asparaginase II [Nesterenkonia xinjiangensis]